MKNIRENKADLFTNKIFNVHISSLALDLGRDYVKSLSKQNFVHH